METKPITPESVSKWVEELKDMIDDPEAAHTEEDSIHRAVLRAIRDNRCSDPVECARLAITTRELDFPRWCA